jgi:L-methionine (R)-S-oxide reductase
MGEDLKITAILKKDKYTELFPQIKALLEGEKDIIANMANICSALKYGMNFFWVGFYLVKPSSATTFAKATVVKKAPVGEQNELVLGPFQGTVACTRIAKGKGVCGVAWQKNEIIIVDDVDKFPEHIACSSLSRSEIVLPVYNSKNEIIAIMDADSDVLASFDKTDEEWLKKIAELLSK